MTKRTTIDDVRKLFSPEQITDSFAHPRCCPFCGADGKSVKVEADYNFFMQCQNCNAQGPQADHPALAAIVWNFRNGLPTEEVN